MNLRQVEAFRAIMRTGTVTSAAEMMRISQPAVSRLISDLERATGLELFIRARKRMLPTPEAETFNQEVERVFAGINHLERVVSDIRNFKTGLLRVAAVPNLGLGFLPKVSAAFLNAYPDITMSIQTSSSLAVQGLVSSGQFDIGLAGPAHDTSGATSQLFARTSGVCVLNPDHPMRNKKVIRPEHLAHGSFVSLSPENIARVHIDQAFQRAGIVRREPIETQYGATACALVQEGLGASIVSPFTAADFRSHGLIIKAFEPSILFETFLLFPANRPRSKLTEAFLEFLFTARDNVLAELEQ